VIEAPRPDLARLRLLRQRLRSRRRRVEGRTRCLAHKDSICGHEDTFYPPLTTLKDALPAFTVESEVKGTLLAHDWIDRDSRSAFLGHFEIRSPAPALAVDPEGIRAK
jgi:hypothetical protein